MDDVLCAKCHEVIRPVVALDLDGTLADYHGSLFDFAADWFGPGYLRSSAKTMKETYGGNVRLAEFMGVSDDQYRQMKLAYRQGGMKRTMPMFKGAKVFVDSLRGLGVGIWITTTRPYNKFDSTDPDTREWLRRNEVLFEGLIFHEDKYRILSATVDPRCVLAVVDDLPDNCIRAEELGIHAMLRRTRYNRQMPYSGHEELDYGFMVDSIAERLAVWQLDHQPRSHNDH